MAGRLATSWKSRKEDRTAFCSFYAKYWNLTRFHHASRWQYARPSPLQSLLTMPNLVWDLALWGRQDTKAGLSTSEPLTEERLVWWSTRMKAVIRSLQQKWPHVPIWLRASHRVGILPALSSGELYPPFHQIMDRSDSIWWQETTLLGSKMIHTKCRTSLQICKCRMFS